MQNAATAPHYVPTKLNVIADFVALQGQMFVFVHSLFSMQVSSLYDAAILLSRYKHFFRLLSVWAVVGKPKKTLVRVESWLDLVSGSLGRVDPRSRALSSGTDDHWSTAAIPPCRSRKNARCVPNRWIFQLTVAFPVLTPGHQKDKNEAIFIHISHPRRKMSPSCGVASCDLRLTTSKTVARALGIS
jgi:hypothetical protein